MSCIIIRKIKDKLYAIESTSYRDEQGRPRTKQRCLGRVDSDGVLISSKTKLPSIIKEVKKVTKKFILVPLSRERKSKKEYESGDKNSICLSRKYLQVPDGRIHNEALSTRVRV